MSYSTSEDFDIEAYYSQYENINKYKCSYCKNVLNSDDDCNCLVGIPLDNIVEYFDHFVYSKKNYVNIIKNSLLYQIITFYINFKQLLSNKKNYNCLLHFNIHCCNITGHICCFQKLLALRKNFYILITSALQYYLWKQTNVNYYNRGINYCCPFTLKLKLPQSELDKYGNMLFTIQVTDDFLLMSEGVQSLQGLVRFDQDVQQILLRSVSWTLLMVYSLQFKL